MLFICGTKTGRRIGYEANNNHALDRVYLIRPKPSLLVQMRENRHQRIYVGLCPNIHHPCESVFLISDLYNSIQK